MNSGTVGMLLVSFVALGGFIAFFIYQLTPPSGPPRMMITCVNDNRDDERKVGVLLDTKNKEIILSGEPVPKEYIRLFNDTAIEARWSVNGLHTTVFIDRIAGHMQIETRLGDRLPVKNKFSCSQSAQRI